LGSVGAKLQKRYFWGRDCKIGAFPGVRIVVPLPDLDFGLIEQGRDDDSVRYPKELKQKVKYRPAGI
jgi:hypothetical protein